MTKETIDLLTLVKRLIAENCNNPNPEPKPKPEPRWRITGREMAIDIHTCTSCGRYFATIRDDLLRLEQCDVHSSSSYTWYRPVRMFRPEILANLPKLQTHVTKNNYKHTCVECYNIQSQLPEIEP